MSQPAMSHPAMSHPGSSRPPASDPVLRIRGLARSYTGDARAVLALRPLDLDIARGSFVAVMGPSGSGKSTLLHCAAGLQRPTAGEVLLDGVLVTALDDDGLATLRRRRMGFVFQDFSLLPALTAAENVELPLRLDGRRPRRAATAELLQRMGIGDRIDHRPSQLSGGQQQRVAIARALVADPGIIFADEPTGALDLHSAKQVLLLLRSLADSGQTIVMVTHDPVAASWSDEVLFLADGRLVDRLTRPTADVVAARMATLVQHAERVAPVGSEA